jgi:hypothetical protein
MFRLVSETVPLTMELSQQFRDSSVSPTEREISPSRMKMLREKAEAGQLVSFHWSKARPGDHLWRMNGQHSSNVLCELNGKFRGMHAHVDDTRSTIRTDSFPFRQFDDRKSGRTIGDVAGAYQGVDPRAGTARHRQAGIDSIACRCAGRGHWATRRR